MKYYAVKIKYCLESKHALVGQTYYKYAKDINEIYSLIENDNKFYIGNCGGCELEVRYL